MKYEGGKYFVETRERLKLLCGTSDIVSRHTDCVYRIALAIDDSLLEL